MTEGSPTVRHAARVVLLDETDRILLVRFEYAGRRWWATPGGGLEGHETHKQAALREVREETGHELERLGPWVWAREHVFLFEDRLYRQVERYFAARVEAFDPQSQELGAEEVKAFAGLGWWTLAELEVSEEEFAPADLPALVRALLEDGPPERPIEVGA